MKTVKRHITRISHHSPKVFCQAMADATTAYERAADGGLGGAVRECVMLVGGRVVSQQSVPREVDHLVCVSHGILGRARQMVCLRCGVCVCVCVCGNMVVW